jgi:psp operon transcriptional activator
MKRVPTKAPALRESPPRTGIQEALGQSEAFLAFQEQVSRVAVVDRPVLLVGERGTGKELAAARIHYLSGRWQEPLIALNCAALPASLIETELFGHEEGAFTGAVRHRAGRFEAAAGGTLFLDELGSIPIETQEKILRVVEYGIFERVGSSEPIQVNVRIVGATNTDLRALAARGRFKEDLLDRVSFEVLFLPPLRERREDVMVLANHFAARMVMELGRSGMVEFTEEAIRVLEQYPWPGNIRELKNVVERAVYRSEEGVITAREIVFDPFRSPYAPFPETSVLNPEPTPAEPANRCIPLISGDLLDKPFEQAVRELEFSLLRNALERAKFNQRKAAHLLGLTYHQFRGIYRKHKEGLRP